MDKTYRLIIIVALWIPAVSFSQVFQTRQADMNGKEVCADAPWRMKLADTSGMAEGLPITIFIDDADLFGANAELVSIRMSLKNAADSQFGSPLTFTGYSDSAFLALFSDKSVNDNQLDCQAFDPSLPVKDASKTIVFTADNCGWPFTCTYVDVTRKFWYFTFTIPADKLIGYTDIIDIKVEFELRWEPDNTTYLRVFRSGDDIPRLAGWYRGDTHFHSMYTQNQIEFGLPLSASRTAAKKVGLDWITVTDHSTDFDLYGSDMQTNWAKQGFEILDLNSQDNEFVFIRGLESSQLNSAGQLVHMLNYPSEHNPYLMNFVADGGGDIVPTQNTIEDLLQGLAPTGGFAYCAHPFAEADRLSSAGNGGSWNVGDSGFLVNGSLIPGGGSVTCNDLSMPTDLFDPDPANGLIRHNLAGGEIWNCGITMQTGDDYSNPWNVSYDNGITPFTPLAYTDADHHLSRIKCGLEVVDFVNRRGLALKNADPLQHNFKFFMCAGSDAHGSFNYSNTSMLMGITGTIDDNAIGSLNTLAYCPNGMGQYGNHILHALRNGHTIMSDGPVVTESLIFGNDSTDRLVPGQDTTLSQTAFENCLLHVKTISTPEFGLPDSLILTVGTASGLYHTTLALPAVYQANLFFSLDSLYSAITNGDTLQQGTYFFIRTTLSTYKNYGAQQSIYRRADKYFHSFTNPLWIGKQAVITGISDNSTNVLHVFPNPAHDKLTIDCRGVTGNNISVLIYKTDGSIISASSATALTTNHLDLNIASLTPGLYTLLLRTEKFSGMARFIKQ